MRIVEQAILLDGNRVTILPGEVVVRSILADAGTTEWRLTLTRFTDRLACSAELTTDRGIA